MLSKHFLCVLWPTPELVLFPADGVDREGVRVLVARGDDGPGQREHATGLLGPRLFIDKVLKQACLIVQDKKPGSNNDKTPPCQHLSPHRPSWHYLNGIKVDYNNELVWKELVVEPVVLTPQWDTEKSGSNTALTNIPVLPTSYKVGVLHQVAINVLHVITGMRCYGAKGDKEMLVKIPGPATRPLIHKGLVPDLLVVFCLIKMSLAWLTNI